MDNNQWHWQESCKAWKGVGIYHVTMVVPSREPLLGELIFPDNDPKQARVERTELGNKIVDELYHLGKVHSEIRILQFCLMPDHLHFIIHVTKPTTLSVREMIRGYWQGAKRYGREYTLSIEPELNSGPINKVNPIFTERPFIRPLSHKGQLQAMYQYVRMNPQRLATKRLMPGFFRVQEGIEIAGCTYRGVGNIALLQVERYAPVHVRRTMVEAAEHGELQTLRDYMNGCVLAARKGTVMVSPFISQQEKAVMDVLIKEKHPFIYIADNGFRDYYKPSDGLFDAVAEGRVLILSPWEYDAGKKHVTRAECVEMNRMAEDICAQMTVPE